MGIISIITILWVCCVGFGTLCFNGVLNPENWGFIPSWLKMMPMILLMKD